MTEQAQLSPEQLQKLMEYARVSDELLSLFRKKASKNTIDILDRYLRARQKRFGLHGPYTLGDIFKFLASVTATVVGDMVMKVQSQTGTGLNAWPQEAVPDLRVLFDSMLDKCFAAMGLRAMTSEAVTERIKAQEKGEAVSGEAVSGETVSPEAVETVPETSLPESAPI